MLGQGQDSLNGGLDFSPRQQQLLRLLAEGKSNKEIAADLRIAYGTVKQHMFTLFRKLSVHNRARAIVLAQQVLKVESHQSERLPQTVKAAASYQWRLVSAAAIVLPEQTDLSPATLAKRDAFLNALHQEANRLVEALDGQSMALPDGGVLVWFGHPKSHQDDAERVLYLVQQIRRWISLNDSGSSLNGRISIGVASHTEVVAESADKLYAVTAFRHAINLANLAATNSYPLVSPLTRRLSPDLGQWGSVPLTDSLKKRYHLPDSEVYSLMHDQGQSTPVLNRWGGLPFVQDLCQGVHAGTAQWLSVSCWPSTSAPALVEALGVAAGNHGLRLLRVRLPHRKTRDVLLNSLFKQIEIEWSAEYPKSRNLKATAGERLAFLLSSMAEAQPLCVMVFGLKSLETFKTALTEKGIELLASKQIMIVGVSPATDQPQATVRALGSRATGVPFARSYSLQLPDIEQVIEKMGADVEALLDEVSPLAREFLIKVADSDSPILMPILQTLAYPHHEIQAAMQELASLGILVPGSQGGFEFQDMLLAQTIRQRNVPLDALATV